MPLSENIPALLLAAGASTRLGQPKQLLLYKNKTLLAHAIETVQAAGFSPLLVITGHDPTGAIQKEAQAAGAQTISNPNWQKGIGTSIRTGLARLYKAGDGIAGPPAVLIMLIDQPLLTSSHLIALRELSSPATLVAAAYNNTLGAPAIIGRDFFPELLALPDDHGAKPLLLRHPTHLKTLPLPEAALDINTPDQLTSLQMNT